MNNFSFEEARKIQSVLDLFKEFFPFQINGKNLETLIFQGGMATDTSTVPLAVAVGETGSAGTIATTLTQQRDIIENFVANENIVGINNLVAALDYEGKINKDGKETFKSNYELGKNIKADYIFSPTLVTKDVLGRIINQSDHFGKEHYWTIPAIASAKQLHSYLDIDKKTNKHRRVGMIFFKNGDSGGHNLPGAPGLYESLDMLKKSGMDKMGDKLIIGGGIRTPKDMVLCLDAGYDAVQIGTLALNATETNSFDYHRNLVLNAKPGKVGKIISPSGFPANGFINEGVMQYAMDGINSPKLRCEDDPEDGCFANCKRITFSADAAGVGNPGDYCIKLALHQLHSEKLIYKNGPVYFCGLRPEDSFIIPYMKQIHVNSLPIKIIIGKLLDGVFDSILNSDGLKDEHRTFLEKQYIAYQNAETFQGKILKDEKHK